MSIFEKESAGLFGVVTTTGAGAITGDFALIHCITATTFTTFTEANGSGNVMTGVVIPAGTVLRGRISAYACSAGNTVRAHKVAPQSA